MFWSAMKKRKEEKEATDGGVLGKVETSKCRVVKRCLDDSQSGILGAIRGRDAS